MVGFYVIPPWDDSRITCQPGLAQRRCPAWRGRDAHSDCPRDRSFFAPARDQDGGGPPAFGPCVLFGRQRLATDGGVGSLDWPRRYLQRSVALSPAALRRLAGLADRADAGRDGAASEPG